MAPDPAVASQADLEVLRKAAAFVYVEDLDAPEPSEEDRHHLLDVLRLREGERVIASDGSGSYVTCSFGASRGGARRRERGAVPRGLLEVDGEVIRTRSEHDALCVAFAMPKGERSEWTVQKLTEIGIDVIAPITSARSVVRLEARDALRRGERLRRIAREAGAQSRRLHLPVLADPVNFSDFVAARRTSIAEMAIAEPGGGAVSGQLRTILVGPEGGWTESELEAVSGRVGLGQTVLRAETAAIVAGTLMLATRSGLIA